MRRNQFVNERGATYDHEVAKKRQSWDLYQARGQKVRRFGIAF